MVRTLERSGMDELEAAVSGVAQFADDYRRHTFEPVVSEYDSDSRHLPDAAPTTSLQFFYRLYGFNRQGAPRETYAANANAALETAANEETIDVGELWRGFRENCRETGTGVNPPCTRGVVCDAARIVNREGNLFGWVGREVRDHGRLAPLDDELRSMNGVGPKIARFFLRDAVWVCGVEDAVRPPDGHLLQSVTEPVRRVAETIWPTLDGADEAVLANQIAATCSDSSVSGVEFNQGAWYLARERADGDDARIAEEIRRMQNDEE